MLFPCRKWSNSKSNPRYKAANAIESTARVVWLLVRRVSSRERRLKAEKLTKEEAKNLMKELCDPADDDGFIPFKRE